MQISNSKSNEPNIISSSQMPNIQNLSPLHNSLWSLRDKGNLHDTDNADPNSVSFNFLNVSGPIQNLDISKVADKLEVIGRLIERYDWTIESVETTWVWVCSHDAGDFKWVSRRKQFLKLEQLQALLRPSALRFVFPFYSHSVSHIHTSSLFFTWFCHGQARYPR